MPAVDGGPGFSPTACNPAARAFATVHRVADQVSIPALGQIEDLTPEAPARFDLLAEQAGVFEVRLVHAKRTIGRIAVTSGKSGTGASRARRG